MEGWRLIAAGAALAAAQVMAQAQFPAPVEGTYVARDFRFSSGETLPEVKLHYRTIGPPTGEPVLVLHGTAGSGASMLNANFGGQLFGPGQPFDAAKHYIILPDAVGHGKSSKPSDGLRTKFPKYNYDDMVAGQYRLLTEHLKVKRLRAVIGNSMGGMQAWIWAQKHPDYMDIAIPMASFPTELSSRNWILRRLITDSIRNDPEWKGGEYTAQPKSAQFATVFFQLATNGGNQSLYRQAPTREKADALLDARLKAPFNADANDLRRFGSQGQQRTAALSLKLSEIKIIEEEKGEKPILLLDDVLSELDNDRQIMLIKSLGDNQMFITTTDIIESVANGLPKGKYFKIVEGQVATEI